MRCMIIFKANEESEAGVFPDESFFAEMGAYTDELGKAGILLSGEGLHPSSKGVRVHFAADKKTTVSDGPFAETKELVACVWIWKVKSMEEAVEWVKRCPQPAGTEGQIEIRPIFEMEDFGDEFTPELREQEERLRADIERQQTA